MIIKLINLNEKVIIENQIKVFNILNDFINKKNKESQKEILNQLKQIIDNEIRS